MKENIKDYSDIENYHWPDSSIHPMMTLQNRAKIFLPFAALKGYEEAISAEKQKNVKKVENLHKGVQIFDGDFIDEN